MSREVTNNNDENCIQQNSNPRTTTDFKTNSDDEYWHYSLRDTKKTFRLQEWLKKIKMQGSSE